MNRAAPLFIGVWCALCLAGCIGGLSLGPLSADATRVAAEPAEVYAHIARGANACWFGPRGVLTKSHIFHAEVDPPWRGSKAHVVIHEREPGASHPFGRRAFQVDLVKDGEHTAVVIENFRMTALFDRHMRADILQWAAGNLACSGLGAGSDTAAGTPPGSGVPKAAKPGRDRSGTK
ncbi:MAG: hypothetical protein ACREC6_07480 [Hyphomicrobiaceae bacterium]